MRACFTIVFILSILTVFSQTASINLSPSHQKKLSQIESGHKRMMKFYKYFKKDSARHFRQINRKEKKSWDSTMRTVHKQMKLEKKLEEITPAFHQTQYSIDSQLTKWHAILNDTTQADSLRAVAQENVRELFITKLRNNPNFNVLESMYGNFPDSTSWEDIVKQIPGIDSAKSVFENPGDLFNYSAELAERRLANMTSMKSLTSANNQLNEFKWITEMYQNKYGAHLNKDSLMENGKDMAVAKVLDYFSENPEKLETASQKVSKLFSKYRIFSNSNDLSDARKITSMEGKTLFERLVVGGTFNVISTKPFSLDLSPQLGYKLTSRFFAGIGMNYRITFSDSIKYSWYVSPRNTAFKAFASYDIIKSWYGYLESEISGSMGHSVEQDEKSKWSVNYFIGAGRRFLIHPKLYMTVTALYNLNNQTQNYIYPQRFQVRVGFQTSDLAFRKKQNHYDPNR